MKKILFLCLFLLVHLLQAQEKDAKSILNNKNEIRIDLGQLLVNSRLQLSYERFLNKDISLGVSTLYYGNDYEKDVFYDSNLQRKIRIEPFFRYSISKNLNRFFYFEASTPIITGDYIEIKRLSDGEYAYYDRVSSNFTNIALGVAIGYKFYVKKHFCFDFIFGGASFIYDKTNADQLPKFGINAGYRF